VQRSTDLPNFRSLDRRPASVTCPARSTCSISATGVVSDQVLIAQKGITPVISLAERLEIVRSVRFVDEAVPAMTSDELVIWRELQFDILFKGDDWRGTEKCDRLERDSATVGVEVVYFSYTKSTSSSVLRKALHNIEPLAENEMAAAHLPIPGLLHGAVLLWHKSGIEAGAA
jgi:glycerol-3-phosphate cytidylyltransferase